MVPNRTIGIYLFIQLFICTFTSYAGTMGTNLSTYQYPFYAGFMGGYGSTTWSGLVPTSQNQNSAMRMFTPVKVNEGGGVWGVLAGYELTPWFAVEANYMHFANARVKFDEMSVFTFISGLQEFVTHTEVIDVLAKIMLTIPDTKLRFYSAAGIANIHRKDLLLNHNRLGPAFAVGFNYNVTDRIMMELVGNYVAGYGESQLSPSDTYFPFLYSVTARLAYRFHGF